MGASIIKGQGSSAITWTVQSDVTDANIPENINNEFENIGVKRFDFRTVSTISYSGATERTNLLSLLIHLWPGDWCMQISQINSVIDRKNNENAAKIQIRSLESQTRLRSRMKHITEKEFWIFLGLSLLLAFMGDLEVSGTTSSQKVSDKK